MIIQDVKEFDHKAYMEAYYATLKHNREGIRKIEAEYEIVKKKFREEFGLKYEEESYLKIVG